jgi:hypothetical protein
MEIFGGFMVMMSIIGFFLAVVWLIMPFVVFTIKGKQDRTLEVLEAIEKRMATLESRSLRGEPAALPEGPINCCAGSADSSRGDLHANSVPPTGTDSGKNSLEASPAV